MSNVVHRGVGGGIGGGGGYGINISENEKDCENTTFSTNNEKSRRPKGRLWLQQTISSWRSWIERKTKRIASIGSNNTFLALMSLAIVYLNVVFLFYPLTKWTYHKISRLIHDPPPPLPYIPLDFIVAGFPKCGTTTLLKTLSQHVEIKMPEKENCQLARPLQQDDVNLKQLVRDLYELKQQSQTQSQQQASSSRLQPQQQPPLSSHKILLGIKCPDALKNFKTIHRLSQHSPQTKFIIGIRHPILYIQSLYNYRVLEVHLGKKAANGQHSSKSTTTSSNNSIPTLWDIYTSAEQTQTSWWDVSPMASKFEIYLSQFAKTNISVQEMQNWFRPTTITLPRIHQLLSSIQNESAAITTNTMTNAGSALYSMLAMKPNHFQIFFYTLNQLQEEPSSSSTTTTSSSSTSFSSTTFRHDLQTFLNLQHPIAPFGHDNKNHHHTDVSKKSNTTSTNTRTSTTNQATTTTTNTRSLSSSSFSLWTSTLLGLGGGGGNDGDGDNNDNNDPKRQQQDDERLLLLPGMIDICNSDYDTLRNSILNHYQTITLPWIVNQFMSSPDVVVSQPEFVTKTLQEWTMDPCTAATTARNGSRRSN